MDYLWFHGNDAAVALAEFIGGDVDTFVNMMNQKATELELTSTHFVTPHGLDEDEHYSTAFELAKIADYALQNETFSTIVKTSYYSVTISGNSKSLHNTNELLGYLDGIYGVKTGFTNGANRCLVTSCKRGSLDIICIVLGCDTKKNRTLDSINLINYAFNNYTVVDIKEIIYENFDAWNEQNKDTFHINKGVSSSLDLYLKEDDIQFSKIAILDQSLNNIKITFQYETDFESPLYQDTVIGYLCVNIDDSICFDVEILNKNNISKKNILLYLKTFIYNYINYFKL